MTFVVMLVGILISAVGICMAIAPQRLLDWIAGMEPRLRFRVAIVVRVALGAAFLAAAPASRLPGVVYAVGIIALVAAAGILVMGQSRLDALLVWWLGRPRPFVRGMSAFAIGLGALLVYAGAA